MKICLTKGIIFLTTSLPISLHGNWLRVSYMDVRIVEFPNFHTGKLGEDFLYGHLYTILWSMKVELKYWRMCSTIQKLYYFSMHPHIAVAPSAPSHSCCAAARGRTVGLLANSWIVQFKRHVLYTSWKSGKFQCTDYTDIRRRSPHPISRQSL